MPSQKKKMPVEVVQFPNKEDLKREPPKLEWLVNFAGIAEAYAGRPCKQEDVVAFLQDNGYSKAALLLDPKAMIRELRRDLEKFLGCGDLIDRAKGFKGTELTPVGQQVGEWANSVVEFINEQSSKPSAPARKRLVIATHQIFEFSVLSEVLGNLARDARSGTLDILVEQIESADEGIGLLRAGKVDAVLDGVLKSRVYRDTQKVELGPHFKRVILVPKELAHLLADESSPYITMAELRKLPLAYVDMPALMSAYLRVAGSAASRVRVSTISSVVKLVQSKAFFGLAVNWTTLLGNAYPDDISVRFIKDADLYDEHWRLFVRPKEIRISSKPVEDPSPLELLGQCLKNFAKEHSSSFVLPPRKS